jgi:hypothetical protein
MALLGLALFWLVFHPELIPQTGIEDLEILSLSAGATFCVMVPLVYFKFLKQPEYLAFFSALTSLLIVVPATSITDRIFIAPYREVVTELKKQSITPQTCIWDMGPMTANLSLMMGQELGRGVFHNRCEYPNAKFLILPKKGDTECAKRKMSVLLDGKTLTLCGYSNLK